VREGGREEGKERRRKREHLSEGGALQPEHVRDVEGHKEAEQEGGGVEACRQSR